MEILVLFTLVLTLIIDMTQTLKIQDHTNDFETNPFLGKHPSDIFIVGYFLAWIGVLTATCFFLPHLVLYLAALIILPIEIKCIVNNLKLGLGW